MIGHRLPRLNTCENQVYVPHLIGLVHTKDRSSTRETRLIKMWCSLLLSIRQLI